MVQAISQSYIYVGGEKGGLVRKQGGSDQWESLTNGLPADMVVVQVAVNPTRPEMVLLGTRDGAYITHDRGDSWSTAGVFLDKYGPDERYDVVKLLPNVKVPVLVTIGGLEGVQKGQLNSLMGFAGLASEVGKLSAELDHLSFAAIPNADHAYTGQRDYAWKVAGGFLGKK